MEFIFHQRVWDLGHGGATSAVSSQTQIHQISTRTDSPILGKRLVSRLTIGTIVLLLPASSWYLSVTDIAPFAAALLSSISVQATVKLASALGGIVSATLAFVYRYDRLPTLRHP